MVFLSELYKLFWWTAFYAVSDTAAYTAEFFFYCNIYPEKKKEFFCKRIKLSLIGQSRKQRKNYIAK